MAELVVAGREPLQRWRRPLREGQTIRLGRAPRDGWAVPWDPLISREHADVILEQGQLKVRCLKTARNPVYFQEMATTEFTVQAGERFRIGETTFELAAAEPEPPGPSPAEEHSFHPEELSASHFRDADNRLRILARLPSFIAQATDDAGLADQLVELALDGIPSAQGAAVVRRDAPRMATDVPQVLSSKTSSGDAAGLVPSRRLIRAALERGEGVLHVWEPTNNMDDSFTVTGNLDWAFCVPFSEQTCRGWCLYLTGQFGEGPNSVRIGAMDDLKENMQFAALLIAFIGSIRRVRVLERQQAGFSQFFSPAVLETLRHDESSELLNPRETDITVLFCDVRGFSRKSEQARHDLKGLLNRVSRALGVMTCEILKYDGVIADFQGDAALGFWGWPTEQPDGPLLACRAALEIQEAFQHANQDSQDALAGFKVGIGIAHGRAIAGRIGTAEQSKVGVFGPVVNLGARLESLTKTLRAPILIDRATADYVRKHLNPVLGRVRQLGRIRPYGLDTDSVVSQLLPPESTPGSPRSQNIVDYEAAVEALVSGRWEESLELLGRLPVHDRAKDFLMIFIATNDYEPPDDWDGVVKMQYK